ncbi:hypothetical protein SUDANB130_03428 [Streptomyces sp. enrichment culture]
MGVPPAEVCGRVCGAETPPTGNRGRNKAVRGRLPLPVSGSFDRGPARLSPPRPDRTRTIPSRKRGTSKGPTVPFPHGPPRVSHQPRAERAHAPRGHGSGVTRPRFPPSAGTSPAICGQARAARGTPPALRGHAPPSASTVAPPASTAHGLTRTRLPPSAGSRAAGAARVGATAPCARQVRRHPPGGHRRRCLEANHAWARRHPFSRQVRSTPRPHRHRCLKTNGTGPPRPKTRKPRYQRNVRIRIACRNRAAFARRGCTRSRNARASASSLRNRARRRRRSASQSTSPPAPPPPLPAPSAPREAPAAPADGSRSSCSGIASSPQSVPPTFPRPGGLTPAKG